MRLVWIFIVSCLSFVTAFAQAIRAEDFHGFWMVREDAGDTCVLNFKTGGQISCFWTGTRNNQILKGTWKVEDGKAIVSWKSGQTDVFETRGATVIVRKTFAGNDLNGVPLEEARATRLDSRQVGSLSPKDATLATDTPPATPETSTTEMRPAPLQSSFVGYWEIPQKSGFFGIGGGEDRFFLSLSRSGEARVSLRQWEEANNVRGRWYERDGQAYIEWAGGTKDILKPHGDSFELLTFDPKRSFDDRPRETRLANRANQADASPLFNAGEVQFISVNDVRGRWMRVEAEGEVLALEIDGWGQATKPSTGTARMKGEWRLYSDHIVINWEDGSKDLMRPGMRGFVRESFAPGVPLSSPPTSQEMLVRSDS